MQYIRHSLSYHLSLRPLFSPFLSGLLRQVIYSVVELQWRTQAECRMYMYHDEQMVNVHVFDYLDVIYGLVELQWRTQAECIMYMYHDEQMVNVYVLVYLDVIYGLVGVVMANTS